MRQSLIRFRLDRFFSNQNGGTRPHWLVILTRNIQNVGADNFDDFLQATQKDVANILAVDVIRLCLESDKADGGQAIGPEGPLKETVIALPITGVSAYITGGRNRATRQVTLRAASEAKSAVFGPANTVQSEAILRLDLGPNNPQGLVALGSSDPNRFSADQGTELLSFFAQTLERMLRRWVA